MYHVSSGIVSSGITLNYDSMYVLGGVANETTVNRGGYLWVSSGGEANSTTVNSGGELRISSGGVANSTTVNRAGGLWISSGGVANSTTVTSGGNLWVSSGGVANSTTVNRAGRLFVSSGGVANATTVHSGGDLYVYSGGEANSTTVHSGGYLYVVNGGEANSTTVNHGGKLFVSSGGTANSTTVNYWGDLYVLNGGVANSITVNSCGRLRVSSGGVANSTTVNSGGNFSVSSGGVANSTTVNSGGYLTVSSGGTHKGSLNIANGGTVSAYAGSIIDFTVAGRTAEDGYLINDVSIISGAPTYTITVDADQAYGTYKLAQGAEEFTGTLSIGTETVNYGSITVNGEDFVYNGVTYSLDQVNGNLTLTILEVDLIPPEAPIAVASTLAPTNQNVTITVTYSEDSTVKQYKIGNGAWQNYTSAFTVSSNNTIYFRAEDAAGNESTSNLVISNIDKVAPTLKISGNPTSWTNQNVSLTATANEDGTIEFYNGSKWVTGNSQTVSTNGTYKFRVTDLAGNVTEKSVTVDKIDKVAPTLEIAGNVTNWTNKDVSLTATANEDGTIEFYNGSKWVTGNSQTVSTNGTYKFRVTDLAGNVTEKSVTVDKIDKVAPKAPAATADITSATTGKVKVSATFSADATKKEFSLDGKNWKAYSSSITFTENGKVYFRAFDAAGNVSPVTEYKVSNIKAVEPAPIITSSVVVSSGSTVNSATLNANGSLYVNNGGSVSYTTINKKGKVILTSGATANETTINASGALHVYSGGVASQTTVNQSGYFGIGNGATAYDTTIGYAGELTVWGGGVVSRNTLNTWGAIILSSGALARSTTVNSLGGLHVYSGAVASNTTIKEGGILGAGLGATVYETKLDFFGSATLWGGAVASNTGIGFAGEMTVLSGGLADINTIDTWGAVILSSGAVGNSTTILASGGYHIYNEAVAFTTMITSGAFLGIGSAGTVYNLDVQAGAGAQFFDKAILRGWNDFAGTVTVGGADEIAAGYIVNVDAAGSMINFDLTDRAANVENIINNAAGLSGATYYVTVDPSKAAGRYYLAGNATGINSLTITGTSTILKVGGGGATLDGNTYFALDRDIYNNLYLDIAKISGIAASCGDLESVDLGTWDAVETGCDASLVTSDERKDTGLLAIA